MRSKQKEHNITEIIILSLIFAFVLGVLVYVGGAILQTINFSHFPEPTSALEGALVGVALGLIFGLLQRSRMKKEQ